MAMNPAAARSFTFSQGYSSLASQRAARSAKPRSASSRARRRSACCSTVSSKSMASLYMDGVAEGGQRGLERRLGQRRVGVDRVHELVERRLERAANGELVNHLGRLGADDVHAEDLAGLLVGDDFDEAVGFRERH